MVGRECQGPRRNDVIAATTFAKQKDTTMCKKGGGAISLLLAVKNDHCFCSSMSSRGTDFAEKGIFQTRSQIFRDLRNDTSDFVSDFATLQHAFICAPCGETT